MSLLMVNPGFSSNKKGKRSPMLYVPYTIGLDPFSVHDIRMYILCPYSYPRYTSGINYIHRCIPFPNSLASFINGIVQEDYTFPYSFFYCRGKNVAPRKSIFTLKLSDSPDEMVQFFKMSLNKFDLR